MNPKEFTKIFLDHIKPGDEVLDLGAGNEGIFAQMFLERGAIVTAVDIHPPTFQDPKLIVEKISIEKFCENNSDKIYNKIFARNIIQFLDKYWVFETLFPWIEKHLAPGGIVAIQTFYQDPEPPFNKPMRSLYKLEELTSHFMTWNELYAREYDHMGPDMDGRTHKFFVSGVVVGKL